MKRIAITVLLSALALTGVVSCNKDNGTEDENVLDLAVKGTANCYIVTGPGRCSFPAVKGNSNETVGNVASAEVMWESYSTTVAPAVGDLLGEVSCKKGKIYFNATGKKGNALIAAKDADGTILWSWHIWMTDEPQAQVYANNAGIMMDRNLGALSAVPGDWTACGLVYQWGRKDPFTGACEDYKYTAGYQPTAAASVQLPEPVQSAPTVGTIEYTVAHPTTFILELESTRDWFYTADDKVDNTRWQAEKTIYDPCPAGWVVPKGGDDSIWAKAFGTNEYWEVESDWDYDNNGIDFTKTSKVLGTNGPIWYPAAGLRYGHDSHFGGLRDCSGVWTVSSTGNKYALVFACYIGGAILPSLDATRAFGCTVRCQKQE